MFSRRYSNTYRRPDRPTGRPTDGAPPPGGLLHRRPPVGSSHTAPWGGNKEQEQRKKNPLEFPNLALIPLFWLPPAPVTPPPCFPRGMGLACREKRCPTANYFFFFSFFKNIFLLFSSPCFGAGAFLPLIIQGRDPRAYTRPAR